MGEDNHMEQGVDPVELPPRKELPRRQARDDLCTSPRPTDITWGFISLIFHITVVSYGLQ